MIQSSSLPPVDKFHAHLDCCKRCADNPFDLCPIGAVLLRQAGEYALKKLGDRVDPIARAMSLRGKTDKSRG